MRARGSASERVSCHISPNKKGVSDGIESPLEVPAWFPAMHIFLHMNDTVEDLVYWYSHIQ